MRPEPSLRSQADAGLRREAITVRRLRKAVTQPAFCSPANSFEVGRMLLRGYSNREIAKRLGVTERVVKAGMARLFHEFGVSSGIKRVQLAVKLAQYPIFSE